MIWFILVLIWLLSFCIAAFLTTERNADIDPLEACMPICAQYKIFKYFFPEFSLSMLTTLDEESQKELDKAKAEHEKIIKKAKENLKNKKTEIKSKSEKRKICNKLGLTLEDLENIKLNRGSSKQRYPLPSPPKPKEKKA